MCDEEKEAKTQAQTMASGWMKKPRTTQDEVNGAFEADGRQSGSVFLGCIKHQEADKIVSNEVDEHLLADHCGAFGAKQLHADGGLDVAKTEFDTPSLAKKFR